MCGVMLQELDAKVKCLTSRVDEKSSEAAMLRQQLDEHISARLSGVDDSAAANDAHAAKLARENYALRTEVPYIGAILLFFIFLVHVSKQSISFFNCHNYATVCVHVICADESASIRADQMQGDDTRAGDQSQSPRKQPRSCTSRFHKCC